MLFLFARTYKKAPEQSLLCSGMVPVTGLEPVRCRQRRILSPLRLPIPSHRQVQELLYAIAVPFASKILRSNGESKVYVAFMIAGKSDRANCPGHFWQKW